MNLLAKLPEWFEKRPLVLLSFEDGFEEKLRESKHGFQRFTIVRPHGTFDRLKLPTLCLAEMPDEEFRKCYVGVAVSQEPASTFDTRITVIKLQLLKLSSFESLATELVGRKFQTDLERRLNWLNFALGLTPKLSAAIIKALATDPENRKAIEVAAFNLPKLRQISIVEWEQLDAIKTAMAAFGLSKADTPELVDVPDGSDSTLNSLESHALEDNVIARDASVLPGFSLIEKHVTGLAVFERGDERLDVYTANKGPLETMLGVDLIYINETLGTIVMIQYKMLAAHRDPVTAKTDWIFRPDDQLMDEVARMELPPIAGEIDDYRLHASPFFFKFVKRKGDGESHHSFVISLEHLNHLLASAKSKGPRGGLRISYEGLGGSYLRDSDLIGLIRSGYIGTHRVESDALHVIISEVAKGNRALVLAWQQRVKQDCGS